MISLPLHQPADPGFSQHNSRRVKSLRLLPDFHPQLVVLVEIIAFLFLVMEHGPLRRVAYVLVANLVSLALGDYLFTILPV